VTLRIFRSKIAVGPRTFELSAGELPFLVALARARRLLSCRELAFQLYPEIEEELAHNRVYVYLHRLRKRYGEGVVIAGKTGYRLDAALFVDLWECDRVIHRISTAGWFGLTPGERAFLEDAACENHELPQALPDSLMLYVISLGRRLRVAYAQACAIRGDGPSVLRIARSMLVEDPCDEIAHELAIRAHLFAGNRLAALAQWSEYRAHLHLELSTDPSPKIRALLELDCAADCTILMCSRRGSAE
jgi:DNA-binding SARP family transcriptional activator